MSTACRLLFLLLLLAVTAACSSKENVIIKSGELSYDRQQAVLRKKVAALLEKKSYRRAIELMTDRNQPGSPPAGLEKEYLLAINGVIAAGEESLSRGDNATAGQSFRLALDSFPVQPSLRGKVRRNQSQIKKQLDISANRLLEQGFMEYRSGNLETAIRKWKEIIVFDAGHMEASKAIDTATIQLRMLRNMEKPSQ